MLMGHLTFILIKCLDIMFILDCFSIAHIPGHDNWKENKLAQQTSGYHDNCGVFHISQEPMLSLPI